MIRPKHFLFVPIISAAAVAVACVGIHTLFRRRGSSSINLFSLWFRKLGRVVKKSYPA